jgi:hypothetical protein
MRSEPTTFIDLHNDNEKESRKSNCRKCLDLTGKLQKLVPRYVDGIVDDKFKICSYCGEIYPIYEIKLEMEYEPKAVTVRNPFDSGTRVDAVDRKRKYKQKKHGRDSDNYIEIEDIPKFGHREDKELKSMLKDRVGIINYITDTDVE